MKIIKTVLLILFISSIQNIYSQCSDAGVCVIGDKHKKTQSELSSSSISFQYTLGFSGNPEDITYHTFKFGGDMAITNNFSITASLPVYSMVFKNSNTFNKNGIGDAFLLGSYNFPTGRNKSMTIQGGFKLNTSSIDKEKFGYTNAQGTNDFLIGADYNYSFLNLSCGIQIPFTNYKENGLEFKRGTDLMIKTGFQRKADAFLLRFEVLGIKRLNKSELVVNNISTSIENSDFFQLNILGGISYKLSPDFFTDLSVALPMIKRDDNSDGTKRVFTSSIGFRYNI